MRFSVFTLVFVAAFLSGCAREGIIVQKESRAHPFYHSLGVEGVYAFLLRDNSGAVHRQMVTAEVFEQYAEGEYFNDLQPSTRNDKSDGKTMRSTAMQPAPAPAQLSSRTRAAKLRLMALKAGKGSKVAAKEALQPVRSRTLPRRSLSATKNLTVATVTTSKKSITSKPRPVVTAPAKSAPAPAKPAIAPVVRTRTAAISTPVLPTTGGGNSVEPEIVFVPPRVR